MIPYLDADFLLTLLVNTDETHRANTLLRRTGGPLELNSLHQLQAENLIMRRVRSTSIREQQEGERAFRLWNNYHTEAVFAFRVANWEAAYQLALKWNRNAPLPPPPLLLYHPALATVAGASHFLSFNPRSRAVAKRAGLKLLPNRLD
jgi:hypothetical protein